jgi:inositol 3-alpha-galactosyltransferase
VICLLRSLRLSQSRYNLIVIYTADTVSRQTTEQLQAKGCVLRPVQRYLPEQVDHTKYKMPFYTDCWCKLRLWEFEEYSRLVYLDADMIVLKNIDHLFHTVGFHAALDCTAGRHNQAERDACPLFKGATMRYFNAGMFVMTPNKRQMEAFEVHLATGYHGFLEYAEQDFLNDYYTRFQGWIQLPPSYNLQKGIRHHHPELWAPLEAHVLHYTDFKPWNDTNHPENASNADIVCLWWKIFDS